VLRLTSVTPGAGSKKSAAEILREWNKNHKLGLTVAGTLAKAEQPQAEVSFELEINDFPQKARWKVTNKEMISSIIEQTGVAITTRGSYFPPGKAVDSGERKLYLVIEGENAQAVDAARKIIKETLVTATAASIEEVERRGGTGRYSIV